MDELEKAHKDYEELVMDELEKAHQDYEERKARLIDNLETLAKNLSTDSSIPVSWIYWIEYAIEFLKEKEI